MISKTKRKEYLKLTIKLVKKEINKLQKLSRKKYDVSFDKKIKKELKSPVDKIIERDIIRVLYRTNINILSEETGFIKAKNTRNIELSWIVDPLDGTANFSRNLGDSGVSIALFEISKTSIFLNPISKRLSTNLLSPAPTSIILSFKDSLRFFIKLIDS